jgi:hypothetical protein
MGISDKLETYLRLKLALDRLSDAYIGLSLISSKNEAG